MVRASQQAKFKRTIIRELRTQLRSKRWWVQAPLLPTQQSGSGAPSTGGTCAQGKRTVSSQADRLARQQTVQHRQFLPPRLKGAQCARASTVPVGPGKSGSPAEECDRRAGRCHCCWVVVRPVISREGGRSNGAAET
ncbi:hypothetical protein KM043_018358 [Ampulex compressa]|nr:hypothetical protein KM043_018358 [Ampulex compressa]